jgi:hypothetical protein
LRRSSSFALAAAVAIVTCGASWSRIDALAVVAPPRLPPRQQTERMRVRLDAVGTDKAGRAFAEALREALRQSDRFTLPDDGRPVQLNIVAVSTPSIAAISRRARWPSARTVRAAPGRSNG